MRKMINPEMNMTRARTECYIKSILCIGLDYGFMVRIGRYETQTVITFTQHYDVSEEITSKEIQIVLYHFPLVDDLCIALRENKKGKGLITNEEKNFSDYNNEALECIMKWVWSIEG